MRENTRIQHRTALGRLLPILGNLPVDGITPADVAALVAELARMGKARESIRKTVTALAMVLDHAGVQANPARDRVHVRLPREQKAEIVPPTAEHVLAVHDVLPLRYRLPLLVLDATGMRLGELEHLTWGDVDEPHQRWRVSAAVSKTSRARWVSVPSTVFAAVLHLCPRRSHSRTARVRRVRRRQVPNRGHAGVHRGRRPRLLAA